MTLLCFFKRNMVGFSLHLALCSHVDGLPSSTLAHMSSKQARGGNWLHGRSSSFSFGRNTGFYQYFMSLALYIMFQHGFNKSHIRPNLAVREIPRSSSSSSSSSGSLTIDDVMKKQGMLPLRRVNWKGTMALLAWRLRRRVFFGGGSHS